jgi:hypothetical protein
MTRPASFLALIKEKSQERAWCSDYDIAAEDRTCDDTEYNYDDIETQVLGVSLFFTPFCGWCAESASNADLSRAQNSHIRTCRTFPFAPKFACAALLIVLI